ncbi:MAG TPA: DNA-directed RNA polymerase subunit beta [Candidatus Pacearchaeota archaeon]|nr:DNA-directed RNA polymerase subunit beta [Candidatus Pacearchaeota archaeon]HQI74509.1 DNA-directed RNA polymerase subunit beta [Candidatus Pacearchaeota archaeon]
MKKIKIKSFNKSKVDSKLPYFLQSQKYAWEKFWQEDLKNLLEESSPIRDYTGKEFELWFLDYKLGEPNYPNDLEAKNNDDSYTAPLKVKVKLINLKTKEEKTQEVFLTNFPLMTERGTFLINGVERVVVSQLIRSPGVFFTARVSNGKKLFSAKIIPYRGSWLEFDTDANGFIGVKIDRKRRVAATTLLRVFGVDTDSKIRQTFKDVDIDPDFPYIEKTIQRDPAKNQEEAGLEIYSRLRPGDMANAEAALEFLGNMFFNFNRYDLSKVGRWKTNQRLPEIAEEKKVKTITTKERVLTKEDVVATLREIIRLNNNPDAQADQIDHLGNRRVRTFTELLLNSLKIGMMRLERNIKDSMSTVESEELNPVQLINQRPIMASVRTFFSSSQLAQFMDQTNPLSELEHKREVISTGPGGLVRKRAGFEVRDVQPSHYGRICPIQTPDGPNVGLIGHIACYGRINDYGFLETPYIKVEDGKITSKVEYLDAYSEERNNIAPADILIDDNGKIIEKVVEARIKGKPGMIEKEEIDYIDVSPNQTISVAASLIPFLQNDDAKRASMGSNMQRQAVPLIKPDIPLVGTGLEEKVARDSGQVVLAEFDGIVESVDAAHIKIKPAETEIGAKTKTYNLRTFVRTNQYTCFHQRPLVKKGQKVKKGDIISDGGSTKDGQLALGKNLLVAFVPWRGWNYEDAIVISERLVQEDEFSSIHVESFNCDVRETKLGPEITTADIPNVSEEKLKDLDEEGIIRVGAEVGPNDILVGKISPKGERDLTPEEELVQAIFGEKARDVKDTSLMMEHGKKGRVVDVKIFERAKGFKLDPGVIKRIKIEVAQLRKIGAGDKLAGRHGNKGVISTVLPVEEMPYLEDGTPVDIVLNPLGIISRLNIGQILETHLGLAAKKLGYVSYSPSLSGAKEIDIKKELKEAGCPEDGKLVLYDGKTSEPFPEKCTVGYMYVLKLNHMVEDKLHMRSIGTYSLITQQPLGGKSQFGGQRFGEMEVWALEGYGAAYTLQEMLTIKSDDVVGRGATYNAILRNEEIKNPNIPASFNLLMSELKSLALDVEIKGKIIKEQ